MHLNLFSLVAFLLDQATALIAPPSNNTSNSTSKFSARTVFQFPKGYWLENQAVRHNGHVLATTYMPSAGLYMIDPTPNATYPAVLVHRFENSTSALGIVESNESDTFYMATLNFSATDGFVSHSSQIWSVNMSSFDYSAETGQVSRKAAVSHITQLSSVGMANGLTLVDENSPHLLIADSLEGAIWDLDTITGQYHLSSSHQLMRSNNAARKYLGIDGIRIHSNTLYFNNAGEFTLSSMPINPDGTAKGDPNVIATGLQSDEFCFYDPNTVLVTMNIANGLAALDLETHRRWMVAGNTPHSGFTTPTSVELGRGKNADRVAYVTMGGTYFATDSEDIVGGSLVVVDLESASKGSESGRQGVLVQENERIILEL